MLDKVFKLLSCPNVRLAPDDWQEHMQVGAVLKGTCKTWFMIEGMVYTFFSPKKYLMSVLGPK